jgi:hypothetical protein
MIVRKIQFHCLLKLCDLIFVRIQVSSPTTYGISFKSFLQIKTCNLMLNVTLS